MLGGCPSGGTGQQDRVDLQLSDFTTYSINSLEAGLSSWSQALRASAKDKVATEDPRRGSPTPLPHPTSA